MGEGGEGAGTVRTRARGKWGAVAVFTLVCPVHSCADSPCGFSAFLSTCWPPRTDRTAPHAPPAASAPQQGPASCWLRSQQRPLLVPVQPYLIASYVRVRLYYSSLYGTVLVQLCHLPLSHEKGICPPTNP
eukprot:COSAG01_NODE_1359_length_10584_cov_133.767668_8_plen_131_part_00